MSKSNENEAVSASTSGVKTFKVYVVTYNVNSRFPDNISLRNLLNLELSVKDGLQDTHLLPDIYAVGFQEVNSHPQQQVKGLFKEDPWISKVKKLLRQYDYVGVKTEQMQGLLLVLFVKRQYVPHLRDIEAEYTRTGFGGIWGNKGAVSIRFNLYGCGLVFVVAHLAAHDHHLDERIEDYQQIMENHHYHVQRFREIYDHDYVFWFGDLNFRLNGEDSPAEINAMLEDGKFDELLDRDQLFEVREQSQKAFRCMHERKPAFPPTFKFKEGVAEYDFKRRPAWTDRIMYAVQPHHEDRNGDLAIDQLSYKSHPAYIISDHKPVSSEFAIKLYADFKVLPVSFPTIDHWPIGEDFIVEYTKPSGFEEREHDWIGLFPKNFDSLSDYIAYEYVNQSENSSSDDSSMVDMFDNSSRRHHHRRHKHKKLQRQPQGDGEKVRIEFANVIELTEDDSYCLIYIQNSGYRGVCGVGGVSNNFQARFVH